MRWKPELLKILDATMYYNQPDNSWYVNLNVGNNGEGRAEIYKLEVHGIEQLTLNPPLIIRQGERNTYNKTRETIQLWNKIHSTTIP
jgi:hypothetical protein